jgi:acetyltransferase
MAIRTLKSMFNPRSIAIIGRGDQKDNPAALLARNLIDAGFPGPVLPVNPNQHAVAGVLAYRDVASLPETPELAILTTPLAESPTLISELGAKGTRAVLLISHERLAAGPDAATLKHALLAAAKPYRLRLLGPDRLGMAIPVNGINAMLSRFPLIPGPISVVTQSSTLLRALLSWSHLSPIGFSHLVSLGTRVDVAFSDLLDYLAQEPQTRAILLYLESVRNPRQFLSAARGVARLKPVIALKPRVSGGNPVEEAIYDAAARRAGILRVDTLEHWFNAVETLANPNPVRRNRLLIVGNSRSMGLLASDRLLREGGMLAVLSATTRAELAKLVPPGCPTDNPVDLGDQAGFQEYDQALALLLQEPEADGILIVHVPVSPDLDQDSGRAIVERVARSRRRVMISWMGATPTALVWPGFQGAGIALYRTPEGAVQAFIQLTDYRRNQELLLETPPSLPEDFTPATDTARRLIAAALAAGKDRLNIQTIRELLAAYQIPMVSTRFAPTPEAAAALATELGGSVALKILSPEITHQSTVGGVALALEGPHEVFTAASAMLRRVPTLVPDAVIEGFAVQPMLSRRGAYEVAIGVRTGRDFKAGPVLFFSHGGTEARVINDIAYALPPLNMHLARELMSRTRIYSMLHTNPGRPANLDALALTLIKVSQMVVDLGELVELDINPLWVNAEGVLVLSARIRIAAATCPAAERLAIHPYPKELEQRLTLADGRTLYLRPILPEDEPALQAMVRRMPQEDVRLRFFRPLKELTHQLAARLTQLDYDREMTFVLTGPGVAGKADIWGMVSLAADPDLDKAEYAIAVDRSLAGQGLGFLLMRRIIDYARQRGIQEVFGEVLQDNESMLKINRALGFTIERDPDDPNVMHVSLPLSQEDTVTLFGARDHDA